ncbi:MAG: Ig domain-containing protein [Ruminococcus sp.]|nr:Ig domain-containing protein [Ruminococcus sp.]
MKHTISIILSVILLCSALPICANAAGKSFYADKKSVTVKSKATVTVTSKKGGTLNCKIADKSICSASWGKWKNNKIKLTIKAKKNGKTTITVKSSKSKKPLKIKVTVKLAKTKSISLSKKSLTIKKGDTYKLKCTVKPASAKQKVKWTSSNPNVAQVNSSGKITAKKSGEAEITAETTDGTRLKAKCAVTVLNKTINSAIKANLKALRDYILQKGDTNSYGEPGIFGKEEDSTSSDLYSIRYLEKDKTFVFGYSSDYSDEPREYVINDSVTFNYSILGADEITAKLTNYYDDFYGDDDSYSCDITFSTASYNPNSVMPKITITSNTSASSSEKIKEYANTDFKCALAALNLLLYNETKMTLADIGFTSYNN